MPEETVADKLRKKQLLEGMPTVTKYGPAVTRFTRTPVTYSDPQDLVDQLAQQGIHAYWEGAPKEPSKEAGGEYEYPGMYPDTPKSGKITIDLNKSVPFRDVMNTTLHEDIHAALQQAGMGPPRGVPPAPARIDPSSWQSRIATALLDPGSQPEDVAYRGMLSMHRAGDPKYEVPAYAGATP